MHLFHGLGAFAEITDCEYH